jgi:hypothetical protein
MATELGAMAVARPTGWPRRFTLVLFFTCALILYIDRVSISVVAPILMTEFGWDQSFSHNCGRGSPAVDGQWLVVWPQAPHAVRRRGPPLCL